MAFKQLWFWKSKKLTDRWRGGQAFSTEEFKRPSIVISENKPTEADPIWSSSVDNEGNLVINFDDDVDLANTPPLWYVVRETPHPHPGGPPIPMVFIYAMYGDDFSSGTIVMESDLINKKFTGKSKQVGFIQWFKKDSKIQQIYVAKEWRRKRITLALFGVADLVIVAGNEYTPFLHGGEVTTEDGETLRNAWSGSLRVDPRIGSVEH